MSLEQKRKENFEFSVYFKWIEIFVKDKKNKMQKKQNKTKLVE